MWTNLCMIICSILIVFICRRIISLHFSLCDSPVVVSHIGVLLGSHVPNPLSNVHLGRQNEVPSCHSCPNHSGTTNHFSYYHRAKWWLWYHHLWLLLLSWLESKRYILWCGCPHKYYVHHLHISLDNHCLEHSGTLCICIGNMTMLHYSAHVRACAVHSF